MDEENPDDELQVLRAHDPAARLRAPDALRQRVAAVPGNAAAPRAHRGWLVAAAAAIALTAGGAGYAFAPAREADDGPRGEVVALTTPAPGEVAAAIEGAPSSGASGASGADAVATDTMAGYSIWGHGWGGRQRFTVPVFDDTAGTATVYAVDGSRVFSAENAVRVAEALGLSGEAVQDEYSGSWTVGGYEKGGPSLSLSPWSGGLISYYSGHESPYWPCVEGRMAEGGEDWDAVLEQCRAETPQPNAEQALAGMSTALAALGIAESEVEVAVRDDGVGEGTLTARASRVVDRMATPVYVSVTVTADGIVHSVEGMIGDLVSLGEYDIVSPAKAAARLNTAAFSPDLVHVPPADSADGPVVGGPPDVPSALPSAGSAVPWPIAAHEIVSARLGLSSVHGDQGRSYVVPAYEFTDADGMRWSVIALAEHELDTASPGWATRGYAVF